MRCLLIAICAACSRPAPPAYDVVGDPLGTWRTDPAEAFARNIWDLQEYAGKLYLGYGDAIVNTGPTDVIAFDPTRDAFERETTIEEEAILRYRVFGDRLFMPGVDAVDASDGMLYVRDSQGWTRLQLAQVAHANDVAVRGAEICVALQDRVNEGAVRCSSDHGKSWRSYPTEGWRAVSLFELGGVLYVSSHDSGVRRVDGGKVAFDLPTDALVANPTRCGDDVVFVAKRIRYLVSTASIEVLGMYRAAVDRTTISVTPIDASGTPADVFNDGDRCYALTNRPVGTKFEVTIYESSDARAWKPSASFIADAMARSAERIGRHFYIGLGCDAGQCTASAGRILRVAVGQW